MINFNDGISVTTVTEIGTNYERINCINLNYGIETNIVTIRYFYDNECNYPKDEMTVYFEFSYILETNLDISDEIFTALFKTLLPTFA